MYRAAFLTAGEFRTREDPVSASQQCQKPPQFRLPTAPSKDVVCESKHAEFAGWNQTLSEGVSVAEHSGKGHQTCKTRTETHSGINCRNWGASPLPATQILPIALFRGMNVPMHVPALLGEMCTANRPIPCPSCTGLVLCPTCRLEHWVKITHDPCCCDDGARLFILTKTGRYDD